MGLLDDGDQQEEKVLSFGPPVPISLVVFAPHKAQLSPGPDDSPL